MASLCWRCHEHGRRSIGSVPRSAGSPLNIRSCVHICDYDNGLISCCFLLFRWFFNCCVWVDVHGICVLSSFLLVCLVQMRSFLFLFVFHDWCHFSKTRPKPTNLHQKEWRVTVFLALFVVNSILRHHIVGQTLDFGCAGPCHGSLCSLQDVGAFSPMASGKHVFRVWFAYSLGS